MGDVINLHAGTADVPPEEVLKAAIERDLTEVIVIGWTKDDELYLSMSESYIPDLIWLLASAHKMLMEVE